MPGSERGPLDEQAREAAARGGWDERPYSDINTKPLRLAGDSSRVDYPPSEWSPYTPDNADRPGDMVTTHTLTRFDWRDRLRILFGASVRITTRLETEHLVGASRQRETTTEVAR